MKIQMIGGGLVVQREKGDPHARISGYSGDGWSREHHFMHMVKKELARQLGIHLVKIAAGKDGHLTDDRLPILRPALRSKPAPEHNIGIWHSNYMVRSAAQDYNEGLAVSLQILGDYLDT